MMAIDDQGFPPQVKQARKQSVLTHEDLARKLGISFATVNGWENGKPRPSKLAQAVFDSFCAKTVGQGKLGFCWGKE